MFFYQSRPRDNQETAIELARDMIKGMFDMTDEEYDRFQLNRQILKLKLENEELKQRLERIEKHLFNNSNERL